MADDVAACVDPFLRTIAFCKLYKPRQRAEDGTHEVCGLSDKTVLRLIQQHMSFCGWERSVQSMYYVSTCVDAEGTVCGTSVELIAVLYSCSSRGRKRHDLH